MLRFPTRASEIGHLDILITILDTPPNYTVRKSHASYLLKNQWERSIFHYIDLGRGRGEGKRHNCYKVP